MKKFKPFIVMPIVVLIGIILLSVLISACNQGGSEDEEDLTECMETYSNQVDTEQKGNLDSYTLNGLMGSCWSDTSKALVIKSRVVTGGLLSCINNNLNQADTTTIIYLDPYIINSLMSTSWGDTSRPLVIFH